MLRFADIRIKRKLMLITMVTSGVALLLACAAFVAYELVAFRRDMTENLATLATVIGENSSAALEFDDPESARQTLQSLKVHPHVIGAALYDKDGHLFATYGGSQELTFAAPRAPGKDYRFEDDRLILFQGFDLAGEPAGTVLIESDSRELQARMWRYALIALAVLAVSAVVAFLLAKRLQQAISGPISHLAEVVDIVRT